MVIETRKIATVWLKRATYLELWISISIYIYSISMKTYVLGTHQNHLGTKNIFCVNNTNLIQSKVLCIYHPPLPSPSSIKINKLNKINNLRSQNGLAVDVSSSSSDFQFHQRLPSSHSSHSANAAMLKYEPSPQVIWHFSPLRPICPESHSKMASLYKACWLNSV